MSTVQQLNTLQELDLAIEAKEQSLRKLQAQLGETAALVQARGNLAANRKHLEDLGKQQRDLEWQAETLNGKLKSAEAEAYSGRITNSKELSNLQHEIEMLKKQRGQFDDKILALMDEADSATKKIVQKAEQFTQLEASWKSEQQQLAVDIEQTKTVLVNLTQERQALANSVEATLLQRYRELKKNKKLAVSRISQGTCSVCRIQLPVTDVQKARSGVVVPCSSCGRILYLP